MTSTSTSTNDPLAQFSEKDIKHMMAELHCDRDTLAALTTRLIVESENMATPTRLNGKTAHRGAGGKFAPGNPGGPGRPRAPVEEDYLRIIRDACTLERWKAIVAGQVERAEHGDRAAIDWLSKRLLGRDDGTTPLNVIADDYDDAAGD